MDRDIIIHGTFRIKKKLCVCVLYFIDKEINESSLTFKMTVNF